MAGYSFGNILPNIWNNVQNVPGNLARGVQGVYNNGAANLANATGNAIDNVSAAAGRVGDLASGMGSRFAERAMSAPGNFAQSVRNLPANAIPNLKSAYNNGSFSPSSVLNKSTQAAGLAYDAPVNALYTGGSRLVDALNGTNSPDVTSFDNLLARKGVDTNTAAGKALSVVGTAGTDPMTYLGARPAAFVRGMAGKGALELGGAAMRGAGAAIRGAGSLGGAALDGAGSLGGAAMRGAGAVGRRLTGGGATVAGMRDAAQGVKIFRNISAGSPGAVSSELGSPIASVILGPSGTQLANGIAGKASTTAAGNNLNARLGLLSKFKSVANPILSNGYEGVYNPATRAIGAAAGSPSNTVRHEIIHAMIDKAAQTGNTKGLPVLAKIPAKLKYYANNNTGRLANMAHGFGTVSDELAAQTLENHGLLNQMRGAGNLLFGRANSPYASIFANEGLHPAAVNMFKALPIAAQTGGVAATAGAAGASGSALYNYLK